MITRSLRWLRYRRTLGALLRAADKTDRPVKTAIHFGQMRHLARELAAIPRPSGEQRRRAD